MRVVLRPMGLSIFTSILLSTLLSSIELMAEDRPLPPTLSKNEIEMRRKLKDIFRPISDQIMATANSAQQALELSRAHERSIIEARIRLYKLKSPIVFTAINGTAMVSGVLAFQSPGMNMPYIGISLILLILGNTIGAVWSAERDKEWKPHFSDLNLNENFEVRLKELEEITANRRLTLEKDLEQLIKSGSFTPQDLLDLVNDGLSDLNEDRATILSHVTSIDLGDLTPTPRFSLMNYQALREAQVGILHEQAKLDAAITQLRFIETIQRAIQQMEARELQAVIARCKTL